MEDTGQNLRKKRKLSKKSEEEILIDFIIYLVVIMQNLHGVILATSQSPISARRAKNAYQYQHACKKCISITSQ